MKAYLHRRGRPTWEFEWDDNEGLFKHHGRKHTYAVMVDPVCSSKPIWISLLTPHPAWVTVESNLRATSILFGDPDDPFRSEYIFPGGRSALNGSSTCGTVDL